MADTKISALTELTTGADEDLVAIVDDPSGTPATKRITLANLRTALALPLLHVRDEQISGTNGGDSTATTYVTRVLNTVKTNQITGASLASNQITLPAGTYRVEARAPAQAVEDHVIRLRNITDTTTLLVGGVARADVDSPNVFEETASHLKGRIVLAAQKVLELQHYCDLTKATNGLGNSVGSGEVEVYAEVWIEQEA